MEPLIENPDMQTQAEVDALTKANAERFQVIARIFDCAKTSRCELVLSGLNIDGDPREPFAAIADRLRGVAVPPSTDHWPEHLRALLDIAHTLAAALQSMLDEDDGGLAAGPARADLDQVRRWFARSAYQSEGIASVPCADGCADGVESEAGFKEMAPPAAFSSPDRETIMQTVGMTDWREGSRAIGHDGPELNRWEDYVEVPIELLLRLARLVEADLAYDQARSDYSNAKIAKGTWSVNELPFSHPAMIALRQASSVRAAALASFRAAAQESSS